MPIDYEAAINAEPTRGEITYTDKDVMLYALGVGMGRDPLNADELAYVYEKDLKTVPTVATVLSWGAQGMSALGNLNWVMIVHGEQRLTVHKPIPPQGELVTEAGVKEIVDKGKDKGALIFTETKVSLKDTGEPLYTLGSTIFARGDGGFGGPAEGGPQPHKLPDRDPDMTCEVDTRDDQALLYRLCGDRNPLHADPEFASAAGFPKPILHGLCTYGTCCRAILKTVCDYDHTKIAGFDVRFSSPVFPGETVVVEIWKDDNIVSFRARIKERPDAVVINNGKCTLNG